MTSSPMRMGMRLFAVPLGDEGFLRAAVARAEAATDAPKARVARVRLARWLAARDRAVDEAAALAERALDEENDPDLRFELADWRTRLGDFAGALDTLALRGPGNLARGFLAARAGDSTAAREAFAAAGDDDLASPLAPDLRAALHGWAPETVSGSDAQAAYLDAAGRAEAEGDEAACEGFERAARTVFRPSEGEGWALGQRAEECAERGEWAAAARFTERVVRERPWDADAVGAWLAQAARAGDPDRLGDALAWALARPLPAAWVAPRVAAALVALAEHELDLALVMARRSIDLFGPRNEDLRAAALAVAGRAGDHRFQAAIHDLFRAAGGPAAKAEVGTRVAEACALANDAEGEARALARALGARAALDLLTARVAADATEPMAITALLAGALAWELGDAKAAFDRARDALARAPSFRVALLLAEQAAPLAGGASDMAGIYDTLTRRAPGRHARRLLRARALRFFEEHGDEREAPQSPAFEAMRPGERDTAPGASPEASSEDDSRHRETEGDAERWSDMGHAREADGDWAGAASAMFEAAVLAPTFERWSAVERAAGLAQREDLRGAALHEMASRASSEMSAEVLRKLARVQQARGEDGGAEQTWRDLAELEPADEEAFESLEALLGRRGDYEALAEHLERRAERLSFGSPSKRLGVSALRLRRAAVLEQRLGRLDDARDELQVLLREAPENEAGLSYLGDVYERLEEPSRAASIWARAAEAAHDPTQRADFALRAAAVSRSAGDLPQALAHARAAAQKSPGHRPALDTWLELANEGNDPREIGDALEAQAAAEDDSRVRSDLLLDAARASARAGDAMLTVARAQRAARATPTYPAAQLYARGLEYRLRGAGSPDEARQTIEALLGIEDELPHNDAAIRAFLLAEALDSVQGGGTGMQRLVACEEGSGPHPLLAVAIAERLVSKFRFEAAIPYFKRALDGNLLGLRRRGTVALAAAEAAVRSGEDGAAFDFLEVAASDAPSRRAALQRAAGLASSRDDFVRARGALLDLAQLEEGDARARVLAELSLVLGRSPALEDQSEARHAREVAEATLPEGDPLRASLVRAREGASRRSSAPPRLSPPPAAANLREETPSSPPSPRSPSPAYSNETPQTRARVSMRPVAPMHASALERAARQATTPDERARMNLALGRMRLSEGAVAAAEVALKQAFDEGEVEAGDLLATLMAKDGLRTQELTRLRRSLAEMVPGDLNRLTELRDAALADRNPTYARAVEHVTRALDPAAPPLVPPPLARQREQPGMLNFLVRSPHDAAAEALGLLWDKAGPLFAMGPHAGATAGLERAVPGGNGSLSRAYELVLRLLDLPPVPLLLRRAPGPPVPGVLLFAPAAAVIQGQVQDDSPALRYALGVALAWALPPYALLFGLNEADGRSTWNALIGAFGPPELGRGLDGAGARLAERLWHTLPPRSQRRLQTLLARATPDEIESLRAGARQSGRRVGLFVCGDFTTAARAYLTERGEDPELLALPGELARRIHDSPPLSDLLRLAVSPEYADARWAPAVEAVYRGGVAL